MIFLGAKLWLYGAAAAAIVGAFTYIYFEGKKEAREECLAQNAKVMSIWEEKLLEAEEKNRVLAGDLAVYLNKLEEAKTVRTEKIIEYVEKDPNSNTVVFDAIGLQLLNSAQKGEVTGSK